MLASIFVVILIFYICKIFEKEDQKKTVWKKWLRRKNTALIFHWIVTIDT